MLQKGMQVGLLLFGIFFGAGNLIFPPSLGFMSSTSFVPAIIGFIITGVGMPVIALIMGTFNPGGFRAEMNRKISPFISLLLLIIIYLAIGPMMAIPRTAATSFSIGIHPIAGEGTMQLAIYTALYFIAAWWLSITPSKLLSRVGKVLTPIFAIMIALLFVVSLFTFTSTALPAPMGKYAASVFGSGFIEGYNTLDTLASFAFCIIALNTLKQLGFSSEKEYYASVWSAGVSVAILMAVLYLGLGFLGNHFAVPGEVLADKNINVGAYILTQASFQLFGSVGMWFLAVMVVITCFTTSVGLIASVSQFFTEEFPQVSYKTYVTICSVISFLLANLGLNQIIKVSLPLLLFVYPIAIAVVLLIIVNKFIDLSRLGMRITVALAAIVALIDVFHQVWNVEGATAVIMAMPLGDMGMAWIIPAIIGIVLSILLPQEKISGHTDSPMSFTDKK